MEGYLRPSKFKGESKFYKVGDSSPITNSSRVNERMVKRLKNKLWRIHKRELGMTGRITTHLYERHIKADSKSEAMKFSNHAAFNQTWHEWKTKNQEKGNDFLKLPTKTIYSEIFNGR